MKVPLIPIVPQQNMVPFSTVSMDFITKLPVSDTFDAIAVFVDHDVTKTVVFAPCHSTITAEGTASLYHDHVWHCFGLPTKLISDHSPQFTSAFFHGLCSLLSVEQAMSTAYHPQTDGQTERINQSLEQYLCAYTSIRQNDWSRHLTTAKFTHNNHLHSTIDHTPFFALMGFHPCSLPCDLPLSPLPSVQDRLDAMSHLHTDVIAAQTLAHLSWQDWYHNQPRLPLFAVGDKVWLEGKHVSTLAPSLKLTPRRHGPFPVLAVINDVTFCLDLPLGWCSRLHPVFHASLLSPYVKTSAHGPNFSHPLPDLVDSNEHFEVKSILDSCFICSTLHYLMHWLGYPSSNDQWLPSSKLSHVADLVSAFHASHPSAPSPASPGSTSHCQGHRR